MSACTENIKENCIRNEFLRSVKNLITKATDKFRSDIEFRLRFIYSLPRTVPSCGWIGHSHHNLLVFAQSRVGASIPKMLSTDGLTVLSHSHTQNTASNRIIIINIAWAHAQNSPDCDLFSISIYSSFVFHRRSLFRYVCFLHKCPDDGLFSVCNKIYIQFFLFFSLLTSPLCVRSASIDTYRRRTKCSHEFQYATNRRGEGEKKIHQQNVK